GREQVQRAAQRDVVDVAVEGEAVDGDRAAVGPRRAQRRVRRIDGCTRSSRDCEQRYSSEYRFHGREILLLFGSRRIISSVHPNVLTRPPGRDARLVLARLAGAGRVEEGAVEVVQELLTSAAVG